MDYMATIVNYLKKNRVGGFDRDYMVILILCIQLSCGQDIQSGR